MAGKLREPTLAEGAERLELMVRSVKERQLSETHNTPVVKPVSDSFSLSPEEIWAKKYMTACIASADAKPGHSTSFQPVVRPVASARLQPALAHSREKGSKPVPIGQALQKPVRRRSWLGRLVRGN